MVIQLHIRDKGQIVATLRVLDESIAPRGDDDITYATISAEIILKIAQDVQEQRAAAIMAPAPDEQLVSEAEREAKAKAAAKAAQAAQDATEDEAPSDPLAQAPKGSVE